MNNRNRKYFFLLVFVSMLFNCKKQYNPPAIEAANNYLVVDGYINVNPNETTTITLSRTRSLNDSIPNIPELHAQVAIVSNSGNTYNLSDAAGTGNYISSLLTLSPNSQYQLKINTTDGHHYLSDFVAVKKSPPIDSLTWRQDSSLTVYLNTHDPNNSTTYYKWNYVETWHYQAPLIRYWEVNNGIIVPMDSLNQTYDCWKTTNSNTIITGTSLALSHDVISRAPIITIPQNDEKIKIRYSILVEQIPLTADAYNYWALIQKNSQQLGTLFDPQPSQLTGNIHPLTNPNEPVIGFLSAATTLQKRLFINNSELTNWSTVINHRECLEMIIPQNPSNFLIYDYPDKNYSFYYFVGSGPFGLLLTLTECVDCRVKGGVTTKPSYW